MFSLYSNRNTDGSLLYNEMLYMEQPFNPGTGSWTTREKPRDGRRWPEFYSPAAELSTENDMFQVPLFNKMKKGRANISAITIDTN